MDGERPRLDELVHPPDRRLRRLAVVDLHRDPVRRLGCVLHARRMRHPPARFETIHQRRGRPAAGGKQHRIQPARRERLRRGRQVILATVDDRIRAELLRQPHTIVARRDGQHLRPQPLRQLHRQMPQSAGGAEDGDRVALLHLQRFQPA